jgi:hypothetical protein
MRVQSNNNQTDTQLVLQSHSEETRPEGKDHDLDMSGCSSHRGYEKCTMVVWINEICAVMKHVDEAEDRQMHANVPISIQE